MDQSRRTNIILIGMPGSGKTTVGRILAEKLGHEQDDGDDIITKAEGRSLQDIIDSEGIDYFRALERKILSAIDCERRIITPGGSVCYYPEAMDHLSKIGHIIHLRVDFEELERRVTNMDSRGIVFKPGQTFRELYEERTPIYEKYADFSIEAMGRSAEETADAIIELFGLNDT